MAEEKDLAVEVREHLSALDTFMTETRADVIGLKDRLEKTRQQVLSRGTAFLGGSANTSSDTIGSLVAKSAEVKGFLSGSVRGAAVVKIPGRLVTKSVVSIGDSGLSAGVGVQVDLPAPLPTPPLSLTSLIAAVPLAEGSYQFLRQVGPRSTAGVQVKEGDLKKEAAFQFQPVTLNCETLACWVPVSKQAAGDVVGLSQLIETDLLLSLRILEETEILSGDGTTGHLTGLLPAATVVDTSTAATAIDAVANLIGSLVSQGVSVTGLVLNPLDWLSMVLLKGTPSGLYLLGAPTAEPARVLWGTSLSLSSAMPPGVALAGDFLRGCVLRYREDANVQISSEHEDYFVRNLLAIRAEERVLLAVRQPGSFAKTTLITGTAARQAERK